MAGYGLNRVALMGLSRFFDDQFNDFLVGALLLAYANILPARGTPAAGFIASLAGSAVIIAGAAFFWEVMTPMFVGHSKGDPRDVVAYFAGGAIYLAIVRVFGERRHILSHSVASGSEKPEKTT